MRTNSNSWPKTNVWRVPRTVVAVSMESIVLLLSFLHYNGKMDTLLHCERKVHMKGCQRRMYTKKDGDRFCTICLVSGPIENLLARKISTTDPQKINFPSWQHTTYLISSCDREIDGVRILTSSRLLFVFGSFDYLPPSLQYNKMIDEKEISI